MCDSLRRALLQPAPWSPALNRVLVSLNRPETYPVLQARDRPYPAHRGYGLSVPAWLEAVDVAEESQRVAVWLPIHCL